MRVFVVGVVLIWCVVEWKWRFKQVLCPSACRAMGDDRVFACRGLLGLLMDEAGVFEQGLGLEWFSQGLFYFLFLFVSTRSSGGQRGPRSGRRTNGVTSLLSVVCDAYRVGCTMYQKVGSGWPARLSRVGDLIILAAGGRRRDGMPGVVVCMRRRE